jgi:hypothetical protein
MTSIDICNIALTRLGEKAITALEPPIDASPDQKRVAYACATLYPSTRDTLLSYQPWPWATVRQALGRHAVGPASEYAYQYVLPSLPPILWVISIDTKGIPYQREIYVDPYEIAAQTPVIVTDATTVVMRYIARTQESVFPPMFSDTLSVWLAANLSAAISGKASLRASLLDELQLLLQKMTDRSGHEDWPAHIEHPNTYIDVRGGYTSAAPTRYPWW